jgi:hypothetical protein
MVQSDFGFTEEFAMKNKSSVASKRYRVVITAELEATSRESALAKAQEIVKENPTAKIKLQESYLGWTTVPDTTAPTA